MNWVPPNAFLLGNNACLEPQFPVTFFEPVYAPQFPYYCDPYLFYVPCAFPPPYLAAIDPNDPPPYSTLPINPSSTQPTISPPVCRLPSQSSDTIQQNTLQCPAEQLGNGMPKYFDPSNAPLLTHLLNLKAQDVRRMNRKRRREAKCENQSEEAMSEIKEKAVSDDPFIICKLMAPKKVRRPISIYQFAKRCQVSLESIIASSLVSSPLVALDRKQHLSHSSKLARRRRRGRPKSRTAILHIEAPLEDTPEPMEEERELGEEEGEEEEGNFLFGDLEFEGMERSYRDEANRQ